MTMGSEDTPCTPRRAPILAGFGYSSERGMSTEPKFTCGLNVCFNSNYLSLFTSRIYHYLEPVWAIMHHTATFIGTGEINTKTEGTLKNIIFYVEIYIISKQHRLLYITLRFILTEREP